MRCLLVLCVVVAAVAADEVTVLNYPPYISKPLIGLSSRRTEVGRTEAGRTEAGRYDPGRYDPGRYDPNKYGTGRYNPGQYDPSKYDSSGRWIPDKTGLYNGDRGDRGTGGGQYDGGYGDRGDRGGAGGFYKPEPQTFVVVTEPTTTTPKPKPVNYYVYKYAVPDLEKELLSKVNIVSGFRNEVIGKAFFEYVNPENEVYRTDYIADSSYAL